MVLSTDDDEDDGLKARLDWKHDRTPVSSPLKAMVARVLAERVSTPTSRISAAYGHEDIRAYRVENTKVTTGVREPPKWDQKKFGKASQRAWEKTLAGVTFKIVGGETVCAACSEGEFDCRCDPNPFVERAMKADPLLRKWGMTRNGHSIFAASGADGWMGCDAWALVNAALPDKTSEYAAYGTLAHTIASDFLSDYFNWLAEDGHPNWEVDWTNTENILRGREQTVDGFTFEIDQVMLTAARGHVEKCIEDSVGADEVVIERKVDYSRYMPIPKQGGTLDFAALRSKHCTIDDAKFGEGVKVFAKGNKQVLSYCVAVMEEYDWLYDFQTFTIRINQPRLDHFDTWECTRLDVLTHAEAMRVKAKHNWRENAPRTPGPKQCRWCADKLCPARSAMLSDTMAAGFDSEPGPYTDDALAKHDVDLKVGMAFGTLPVPVEARSLSTEALAWRKKMRPVVDKFYEELEVELLRRSVGNKVPFFKRVAGRGANEWVNEDAAAKVLRGQGVPLEKVFKTEIISVKRGREQLQATGLKPKEIQELLYDGKHPVARYVPGKPVLADEDDDRIELSGVIASGFESDDEDDGL